MKRRRGQAVAVVRTVFSLALTAFIVCLFTPWMAEAGGGWIRLLTPRDKDYAASIVLELDGGIFVCGAAKQNGGEAGKDGVNGITVTKYGSDARQLWTNHFGGGRHEGCVDIAIDGDGNVYAAVVSTGDKGPKAVIARYSGAGEELGYGEYNLGKGAMVVGIAPDKGGNVYIAGFSVLDGVAGKEAFIAKYDAAAQQVWRRLVPKPVESKAEGHAAAAGDGGVYVTGWIDNPSRGKAAVNAKSAFVVKYDADGYFGWMKVFGGKGGIEGNSVAIGPQGEILIAGCVTGDLPGKRGFGGTDAFLAKFSKSGEADWAEPFGTPDRDCGYGAAFDGGGGIYLGGSSSTAVNGKEKAESLGLFLARHMPDGARGAAEPGALSATGRPFKASEAGLVSAVFSGRITLNTGSGASIYGMSAEDVIDNEHDGRWSVRRWNIEPEAVAAAQEKPAESAQEDGAAGKAGRLTSFKAEKKTFLARDINEVGYTHNFFGKSVISVGSVLALAGLLLLL